MNVLVISTVGLKYEGITNVILSELQFMDKEGLNIYVAGTIYVDPHIRETLEQMGCKVVDFPNRREQVKSYFSQLKKFIRKQKIQVVHVHGNSATMAIEMLAAFLGGCPHRVAHSHNTRCDQVKADKMLRPVFYCLCNERLACGNEAGKWLYKDKPFTVIPNGRDLQKFQYQEEVRVKIRKQYQWDDKLVIGHVGGFLPQKNHTFLLQIFQEIYKSNPNAILVLIGDGELKSQIEKQAETLGIREAVFFMGIIRDVDKMLQGMDGMLLPSNFEGLPLVALEWQLAGLPVVMSDVITKDCVFTDLVVSRSLQDQPSVWAQTLADKIRQTDRRQYKDAALNGAKAAGYDARENAKLLKEIYVTIQSHAK